MKISEFSRRCIRNFFFHSSSLIPCAVTQEEKLHPRTPFQTWSWTRWRSFATQARWSATNTHVESGSLLFVAPQTRLCKNVSFQSRSYWWRHKHARLKGPLHWKCRQNVHLKYWYHSIKIHVVTTQKSAVLHTDTPQKEPFPSLFIGKWVCRSVRTDGSTRTMWKVGDGKAEFAFTIRDTHSSDPPEFTLASHCVTFCCRWSLKYCPVSKSVK